MQIFIQQSNRILIQTTLLAKYYHQSPNSRKVN